MSTCACGAEDSGDRVQIYLTRREERFTETTGGHASERARNNTYVLRFGALRGSNRIGIQASEEEGSRKKNCKHPTKGADQAHGGGEWLL